MTDRRVPTPLDLTTAAPYDRTRWEAAVLRRHLHHMDTLVALLLAHHAGAGGLLPRDGIQRTDRLSQVAHLPGQSVKLALRNLERAGLIERPPFNPAHASVARAIALTVPARREEPPHTGERP